MADGADDRMTLQIDRAALPRIREELGLERAIDEAFAASQDVDEIARRLAHRIVDVGHQERAAASKLTGHWIVYKPHAGVKHILTLAAHYDATAARARDAARLDFPQLGLAA